MSQIRALAPQNCPHCGGERTLIVTREKTECARCGYVLRQNATQTAEMVAAAHTRDLSKYKAYYRVRHDNGDVSPYLSAMFTTAMDYVHRQQWPDAIRSFERLLTQESRFFDAHLWLGRLRDDPQQRLKHLETAVAERPDDHEAVRELLIARGQLSEAAAAVGDFQMPEQRHADGAVLGATKNLRCPKCGSTRLTDDEDSHTIFCDSCGWSQPKARANGENESLMLTAMLQRRSQPVQWIVSERIIKCDSCAAQRTLASTQMSQECIFCGSQHVMETDALGSFEQPDIIVPFSVNAQAARQLVSERLNSRMERVKGWFADNRVDSLNLVPMYLPFWVYDVIAEVSRTVQVKVNTERNGQLRSFVQPYSNERYAELINDVFVPASTQPTRKMLFELGRYKLANAAPFKPDYIAQRSAELYSIDFDKAAMDVHEIVGGRMREKYSTRESSNEEITVFTLIKSMSFTLALLPVWIFTLIEKDGDVRSVLVNGQNGRVVMGRARKPQR